MRNLILYLISREIIIKTKFEFNFRSLRCGGLFFRKERILSFTALHNLQARKFRCGKRRESKRIIKVVKLLLLPHKNISDAASESLKDKLGRLTGHCCHRECINVSQGGIREGKFLKLHSHQCLSKSNSLTNQEYFYTSKIMRPGDRKRNTLDEIQAKLRSLFFNLAKPSFQSALTQNSPALNFFFCPCTKCIGKIETDI